MLCPLCGARRARRACPAVGKQICAVCCGTKRLIEIQCPGDCPYLATARDHPPAAVVRQQQRDIGLIGHFLRDLTARQSELFVLIGTCLARYEPPELQPCIDEDVSQAVEALAATVETALRGVIYEHRPASGSAGRLSSALKALLVEAAEQGPQAGGSAFERDAAVALRRVQEAAREIRALEPGNRRAFLDLMMRVSRATPGSAARPGRLWSPGNQGSPENPGNDLDPPRLIVP
jgi:hypothetical protein